MSFFDMRVACFWVEIWDGSISENVYLIEISHPGKFYAFITK